MRFYRRRDKGAEGVLDRFCKSDTIVAPSDTEDALLVADDLLFNVDEIIAYVSRFCTLKTGDLIFTGTPAGVGPATIGTHLKGYLGDEKVLDFHIR